MLISTQVKQAEAKRKKSYSRREILEKLEECENDVKRAVGEIVAVVTLGLI